MNSREPNYPNTKVEIIGSGRAFKVRYIAREKDNMEMWKGEVYKQ